MARFTTRVELHSADDSDYTDLHAAMEARGFSRKVTGSNGVVYQLPTVSTISPVPKLQIKCSTLQKARLTRLAFRTAPW